MGRRCSTDGEAEVDLLTGRQCSQGKSSSAPSSQGMPAYSCPSAGFVGWAGAELSNVQAGPLMQGLPHLLLGKWCRELETAVETTEAGGRAADHRSSRKYQSSQECQGLGRCCTAALAREWNTGNSPSPSSRFALPYDWQVHVAWSQHTMVTYSANYASVIV